MREPGRLHVLGRLGSIAGRNVDWTGLGRAPSLVRARKRLRLRVGSRMLAAGHVREQAPAPRVE
jgi:hypothetical protein